MTNDEKNALMDVARTDMTVAMAMVVADVLSGLASATGWLGDASRHIRAAGDDADADAAQARSNECPAILAIPWPFIYIASNAWVAAVRTLRDSLPFYEGSTAPLRQEEDARRKAREVRAARAEERWTRLSAGQRQELERLGITLAAMRSLP